MEVQGKVKALLPEQKGTSSKTGNPWKSQEFVIYGILTPLVLVGIMALAGWLETL